MLIPRGMLRGMPVSDADKERMRRLARDLGDSETDRRGTAEQRAVTRAWINARRQEIGAPPLDGLPPEEGFYRRARALGMARVHRRDA